MRRQYLRLGVCAALVLSVAGSSLAGCTAEDTSGDGASRIVDDPLKSAANVKVTATTTPTTVPAGSNVDIALNVTTQKNVTADIKLTVYAPDGTSAYTAGWPAQQLTRGTPLVLTEAVSVETADPLGTYRIGVTVTRTGGANLFSDTNVGTFTVTDAGTIADAGTPNVRSIAVVASGKLVDSGSPAFGRATAAGNLLVAMADTNDTSGTFPITVTGAGWTRAGFSGGGLGWRSIWYKPNCGAGEAPPVFHSGGSDMWSQVMEISGADPSGPLLQVVGDASDDPSWTATFPAPDSQPGDLIVGTGYWNGSAAGGTVSITKFIDSSGGNIAGTLAQAGNTWGQYAASVYGTAGATGSTPHTVGLSLNASQYIRGGGLIASFKPASSSTVAAVAITTTALPNATTTVPYSVTLTAANGAPPYTWALTSGSLPAGLSLSGSTGVISGTPTAAGSYPLTFKATDTAGHSGTATLTLNVAQSPPIVFTSGAAMAQWNDPLADPQITGASTLPWVGNNVWGPPSTPWSQVLNVYNERNWFVTANMTDSSGAVHSFPNSGVSYNKPFQNFKSYTSGWDETMDTASDIVASACYDLWFDADSPYVNEVMLHFDFRNRGAGPWWATKLKFGGYTAPNGDVIPVTYWNLAYQRGWGAAFFNLVDANGNFINMPVGSVDLLAMLNYLVSQNILPQGAVETYWSVGFEVCSTNGKTRTFRYNNAWSHAQ